MAEAERSSEATSEEKAERRQRAAAKQTDSLRMAMRMSTVFEKLVPYFTCRALLEQPREEVTLTLP